ncbi:MAG: protoporphyrinogen oxidase [Armatimonadota bacterium]
METRTVAIVGGGITGLSAAYELQKLSEKTGTPLRIVLLERSERFGGKVGTEHINDCLIETGPDSFMAQKPGCINLARELGLEPDLTAPLVRRFYMMLKSKLHEVPYDLVTLVPTKPEALWKASFLSFKGKFRASVEGTVKHDATLKDQSLYDFLSSRFGDEFTQRFAAPMMAGVHNGDPHNMSVAAIYPTYWKMVTEQGSMTRAIMQRRVKMATSAHKPMAPFQTFRNGMGSLISTLREKLTGVELFTRAKVISIKREGHKWLIGTEPSETQPSTEIAADAVLLCTPAYVAAALLHSSSECLASQLNGINYASTAVVSLAYPREAAAFADGASGYLVPHSESTFITGCTYSHSKWPNRAPDDIALFRFFIGYAKQDHLVREEDEASLMGMTHQEARKLMGINAEPIFGRCHRWIQATPQYDVGHLDKMDCIDQELSKLEGLFLAGAAYRGIGVPDCITQGRTQAGRIGAFIGLSPGNEVNDGQPASTT